MPPQPQRGADLFVDTLVRLGAKDAFNIVGTGMYPLGDAFYRRRDDIRYISHLNESNLTLVAQGYARASRKPVCAILYYSSGTALGMVGMTVAWADHVPLVVVSTTSSRITSGRDQYAAVPGSILDMTSQYAKWSFEVPTADRLPEALARAFAIAAQPPMGPVHLAVPLDLWDAVVSETPPCADFERTHTYARASADAEGLAAAAELLAQAERPVLLLGSESRAIRGSDGGSGAAGRGPRSTGDGRQPCGISAVSDIASELHREDASQSRCDRGCGRRALGRRGIHAARRSGAAAASARIDVGRAFMRSAASSEATLARSCSQRSSASEPRAACDTRRAAHSRQRR